MSVGGGGEMKTKAQAVLEDLTANELADLRKHFLKEEIATVYDEARNTKYTLYAFGHVSWEDINPDKKGRIHSGAVGFHILEWPITAGRLVMSEAIYTQLRWAMHEYLGKSVNFYNFEVETTLPETAPNSPEVAHEGAGSRDEIDSGVTPS